MTKAEYTKYEAAVVRGLQGLHAVSTGACTGCSDCGLETGETDEHKRELAEEPHFSWSSCDCCGSTLGGDRHPAHGLDSNNEILHLDICEDCLIYLSYGQLDDMTMLEMEES